MCWWVAWTWDVCWRVDRFWVSDFRTIGRQMEMHAGSAIRQEFWKGVFPVGAGRQYMYHRANRFLACKHFYGLDVWCIGSYQSDWKMNLVRLFTWLMLNIVVGNGVSCNYKEQNQKIHHINSLQMIFFFFFSLHSSLTWQSIRCPIINMLFLHFW